MTKEEWVEISKVMSSYWPRDQWNAQRMSVYYSLLAGEEYEDVISALKNIMQTHVYPTFPSAADIIRRIPKEPSGDGYMENNKEIITRYIEEGYSEDLRRESWTGARIIKA